MVHLTLFLCLCYVGWQQLEGIYSCIWGVLSWWLTVGLIIILHFSVMTSCCAFKPVVCLAATFICFYCEHVTKVALQGGGIWANRALLKTSHRLGKWTRAWMDGPWRQHSRSLFLATQSSTKGFFSAPWRPLPHSVCVSSWMRWSARRSKGISGRWTTSGRSTAEEDSALWTTCRRSAPSATRPYVHTASPHL